MISRINSCAVVDNTAHLVMVESDVHNGLPDFRIVGATTVDVRDSRDRVRVGIENAGFILPPKRITVSLIPAPLKKNGTSLDVAIAVSVLSSFGFIHGENLSEYMFLGEVSLDGTLRAVTGVLFSVLFGIKCGIRKFIVPRGNLPELSLIKDADITGIENLYDMAVYLNGDEDVGEKAEKASFNACKVPSYSHIHGEGYVKQALLLSVLGGHSCLLTGHGESYRRALIEPLSGFVHTDEKEALIRAAYKSIQGIPDIGDPEIAGTPVYYFKSVKEYERKLSEIGSLKGSISVWEEEYQSRREALIYSFYRCRCRAENEKNCVCTPKQLKDRQIMLRRMTEELCDIRVDTGDMSDLSDEQLIMMYENGEKARNNRFRDKAIKRNGDIEDFDIMKYCSLSVEAVEYLEAFSLDKGLSEADRVKILKIALTLSDMEAADRIGQSHICTAIRLRGVYED